MSYDQPLQSGVWHLENEICMYSLQSMRELLTHDTSKLPTNIPRYYLIILFFKELESEYNPCVLSFDLLYAHHLIICIQSICKVWSLPMNFWYVALCCTRGWYKIFRLGIEMALCAECQICLRAYTAILHSDFYGNRPCYCWIPFSSPSLLNHHEFLFEYNISWIRKSTM